MLPAALNLGVTPVEAKEVVYQAVAYLGTGRVLPFLKAAKRRARRPRRGAAASGAGYDHPRNPARGGEQRRWISSANGCVALLLPVRRKTRHINRWLTGNCFGDYTPAAGLTPGSGDDHLLPSSSPRRRLRTAIDFPRRRDTSASATIRLF
jgi:4-carboxymuconolactone decarboxylase